jgi:hypothetical protein
MDISPYCMYFSTALLGPVYNTAQMDYGKLLPRYSWRMSKKWM